MEDQPFTRMTRCLITGQCALGFFIFGSSLMMDVKSTNWGDADVSTLSAPALAEELPSLTAAGVAGVVLAVLLAIAVVFTLGVMLDCRQQKVLGNKVKRLRTRRREIDVESEAAGIAEHMEPSAATASVPAAVVAALRAP